jgi:ligand-binding SRPBCC domain-containing protein
MKTIRVRTNLEASADAVWAAVTTPETFVHVIGAALRYPVAERAGGPFGPGWTIEGRLYLFRVLPVWRHRITVDEIDPIARILVTTEGGGPVSLWRHTIVVEATDPTRCDYSDEIDIEAGALTPVVVAFATVFYRYRQRRWRRLARILAAVEGAVSD